MVQGMIINTIIWVFHIQMFRFKFLSYVGSPADRLYLLTLVIERLVQVSKDLVVIFS